MNNKNKTVQCIKNYTRKKVYYCNVSPHFSFWNLTTFSCRSSTRKSSFCLLWWANQSCYSYGSQSYTFRCCYGAYATISIFRYFRHNFEVFLKIFILFKIISGTYLQPRAVAILVIFGSAIPSCLAQGVIGKTIFSSANKTENLVNGNEEIKRDFTKVLMALKTLALFNT